MFFFPVKDQELGGYCDNIFYSEGVVGISLALQK